MTRHIPGSHGRHRCGVTLVELVIVILIIGILAAVAVPRYSDALDRYRVDVATKRILADLKLAQENATALSAAQTIQFDPATDSYSLTGMPDINQPGQQYDVRLNSLYKAFLISATFGGVVDTELRFDGYGVPEGNTEGEIVVQSGGYQKTITIDHQTGRATVQ